MLQVVENDARRRLCRVSQNGVVASHPWLWFRTQTQALWASQFEVAVVAATTNGIASARLGNFAVAATAVNLGDLGGRRIRTVV